MGGFDVRLSGDYRLSESDEVSIEIQSTEYPLSVSFNNLDEEAGYLLLEIADGVEVGSHRIAEGKDIIISDESLYYVIHVDPESCSIPLLRVDASLKLIDYHVFFANHNLFA